MSARPTELPQWALLDVTETKTINGKTVAQPNKTTIPQEYANSGLKFGGTLIRQYINQFLYLTGSYIQHLDERYSTGDVISTTSAEDAAAISARLGGTWVSRGTQTMGTITVNVWEKTA